jgi:hypothetical protein
VGKLPHLEAQKPAQGPDLGRPRSDVDLQLLEAERQRRRELELGINRISQPKRMPLFKLAAEQRLATERNLRRFTDLRYRQYVESLGEHFGDRLVCDIRLEHIAELRQKRATRGQGNRTINAELQV